MKEQLIRLILVCLEEVRRQPRQANSRGEDPSCWMPAFFPPGGYKQHPPGLCLAEITQKKNGFPSSRGRIWVWVSKYFILQLTKTKGAVSEPSASRC